MSTQQIAAKLREYQEVKAMQNEVTAMLAALEEEIKSIMGESEEISAEGIKARWTRYTTTRFDSTAFKAEHAAMYAEYLKKVPAQRFQVA